MKSVVNVDINSVIYAGGTEKVLSDIRFTVEEKEFVLLTGGLASGKTTLCHCLTGAVPHFYSGCLDGLVEVGGLDIAKVKLSSLAGHIGYMMQSPQSQVFSSTVEQDICFGLCNLGIDKDEILRRSEEFLKFAGLYEIRQRLTSQLSGGQLQRLVLAGVLAMQPKVLILDEPVSELDPEARQLMLNKIVEINHKMGTSIIMVHYRPDELLSAAKKVVVLNNSGGLAGVFAPADYVKYMENASDTIKSEIVPVRNKLTDCERASGSTQPVLQVNEVSYSYPKGIKALHEVSFSLYRGERVVLAGENGSGKTSLAKICKGLLSPDTGQVYLKGVGNYKKVNAAGYLFQNPDYQIFSDSVLGELIFTMRMRKCPASIINERVRIILDECGLTGLENAHPYRLSKGQRQLLAMASILVNENELIIADEPTTGLDLTTTKKIFELLSRQSTTGKAVLIVTHDMVMARKYADRIIYMKNGCVVEDADLCFENAVAQ